jgi:hypothetical protein
MNIKYDDIKFNAYDLIDIYLDKWKAKYNNFDGLLECLAEHLKIDESEAIDND